MSTAAATLDESPRQASAPVEDLERELKFVMPAARVDVVHRSLAMMCRADAKYPDADVHTVYYDTPAFASLYEKLNSDYLKLKVRVRWYAAPGGRGDGPVFLEAKKRIGNRREKLRVRLPFTADEVHGRALDDPIFQSLPARLAAAGVALQADWQPMVALRYRRRRFVDPPTGSRLSLDSDIQATRVNPRFLFVRSLGVLPIAVLEVKGYADELPGHLRGLLPLGLRKQSLSKYATLVLQLRRTIN
jgi:hypothetical protein